MTDSMETLLWLEVTLIMTVLHTSMQPETKYVSGVGYHDEILLIFVRRYAGAICDDFILIDENARSPHTRVVNGYVQQKTIKRMN